MGHNKEESLMSSPILSSNQGYMTQQTALIASGDQESSGLRCAGMALCGLMIPAAFTGTALTFETCDTPNGTYLPLYDDTNTLISLTVAPSRAYSLDPKKFQGSNFLKLKSGTAEGADRSIICSLKGI